MSEPNSTMCEDASIVHMIKESIIELCRSNSLSLSGNIDIDGIVCISSDSDNCPRQLVVKVHDQFCHDTVSNTATPCVKQVYEMSSKLSHSAKRKRKCGNQCTKNAKISLDSTVADIDNVAEQRQIVDESNDAFSELMKEEETIQIDEEDENSSSRPKWYEVMPDVDNTEEDLQQTFSTSHQDDDNSKPSWLVSPLKYEHVSDIDEEDELHYDPVEMTFLSGPEFSQQNVSLEDTSQAGVSSVSPVQRTTPDYRRNEKGTFPCSQCDKIFSWRRSLLRHMNTHTDNRPFVCNYCDKAFHRRDFLRYHVLTHVEAEPHKCGVCMKTFALRKSVLTHMRKFHSITSAQACVLCYGVFATDQCEQHIKIHSTEHWPTLTCPDSDCVYTCQSKFQMMEHSINHFPGFPSKNPHSLQYFSPSN